MSAPRQPDPGSDQTRKGWVIVLALFLMLSIIITARNSLGLMMPFWKDDLGWSYKFVSTASALMLLTMAVLQNLAEEIDLPR